MKGVDYLLPSTDLDCMGCEYAQKQHRSCRKGLLHYCVKEMTGKKRKNLFKGRNGPSETNVHQYHNIDIASSYLKTTLSKHAWKLVGKPAVKGYVPGSGWVFCLSLFFSYSFFFFFPLSLMTINRCG